MIVKSLAYILQHKWYTTISEDSIIYSNNYENKTCTRPLLTCTYLNLYAMKSYPNDLRSNIFLSVLD